MQRAPWNRPAQGRAPALTLGESPTPHQQYKFRLRSYNADPPLASKRNRCHNFEMQDPLNFKLLELFKILTFPRDIPGGAFGRAASFRKRRAGPTSALHTSPSPSGIPTAQSQQLPDRVLKSSGTFHVPRREFQSSQAPSHSHSRGGPRAHLDVSLWHKFHHKSGPRGS